MRVRCLLTLALLSARPALAGGGPENVAVVANAESWASLTLANEYVHLRHISPVNVVTLSGVPDIDHVDVDAFRDRILRPVLQALRDRGLSAQIDCITYSSDLPWSVSVSSDMAGRQFPKIITPEASINGLTYLFAYVLAKSPAYLDLGVNQYARLPLPRPRPVALTAQQRERTLAAMALLEQRKWKEGAEALQALLAENPQAQGLLYNLACCQARLNQPDEAMKTLTRLLATDFRNYGSLLEDEDFASLRPRADFQALVAVARSRPVDVQPTHGFRTAYAWAPDGEITTGDGPHYILSTMLAVTTGRGNSVREALECLRRSAAADGTLPTGTIYYMKRGDIRSRVREWGFEGAAVKLRELGVKVEVISDDVPKHKPDVQGAMLGLADFAWAPWGSTILPGAICEHLTSLGGVMWDDGGQTPLTELIRYGAAGASGTVTEPYALQEKFPDPFIHVHYARGCTLAEAFYQSVHGPYQLLIVGDPLCRPWARVPTVTLGGPKPGETVHGGILLRATVAPAGAETVDHYELFVDGVRQAAMKSANALGIDTRRLPDGYHELRVVAVGAPPIETQGEAVLPLNVNNDGRQVVVTAPAQTRIAWGDPIKLSAKCAGAGTISFFHNRRRLATAQGEQAEVALDSRQLGLGPVQVQAVATIGDPEYGVRVASEPVSLEVVPPPARPPLQIPADARWAPGLLLSPEGRPPIAVQDTRRAEWLTGAGIRAGDRFALTGHFDVGQEDVYQFQVRSDGEAGVEVDGSSIGAGRPEGWALLPVSLASGVHQVTVKATAGRECRLQVRFGGPGARPVGAARFRHLAP